MPSDADRVTVSTYVTSEQRDRWREDADAMGMSQSEFVRSMVQAGRRGFSLSPASGTAAEPDVPGENPRSNGQKTAVLDLLRREGPLEWDGLVRELVGGLEDDLEVALAELQDENRVQHSGRRGGYEIAGDAGGE